MLQKLSEIPLYQKISCQLKSLSDNNSEFCPFAHFAGDIDLAFEKMDDMLHNGQS
jgi:hypothetical protein